MARSPEVRARAKKIASARKSKEAKTAAARKAEQKKKKAGATDCGDKKIRCRSLVVDGTKYRTLYNKKFEQRKKWANPDPHLINSVIPGTVLKIYASEGEVVSEGDQMLILEAMKMKNRLMFPQSGKVRNIRVKEGEKIPKGHLMIEMEPVGS